MNITGRPIYRKGGTTIKPPRKPLRQVSAKRAAHRKSQAGQAGSLYMQLVKQLPCAACGSKSEPRDGHHCKDLPPHGEDGPYQKSPHKHRRSGDRDVIPLCAWTCHNGGPDSLHVNRTAWRERHGPDYSHILPTRAAIAAMGGTIDF